MSLEDYRKKRDFMKTPEPVGRPRRSGRSRIFVVQKHAASRLHYDFRLEINRVLVSWAVPRGPSLNPAQRRLAIRTEDHPLEYADFEGVIPEGQYGAGPVMVWDRGSYQPNDRRSSTEQLKRGEIKFALFGTKLRGGFVLIQTGTPTRWLLIKLRDEYADASWDVEDPRLGRSVLTGRTLTEIARAVPD
jgi:bifunctional non-homologous end joining protein LigD